ncbi:MAG: hypothetical protein AB1405_10020, partial [Bdellovibrionota bacterium]
MIGKTLKIAVVVAWLAGLGLLAGRYLESSATEEAAAQSPGAVLSSADAASKAARSEEDWHGLYLEGTKVGWSHSLLAPEGEGWHFEDEMVWEMSILGNARRLEMKQHGRLDGAYALERVGFLLETEGARLNLEAERKGKDLAVLLRTGGGEQRLSFPVDGPLYTSRSLTPYLRQVGIKPGAVHRLLVFEPSVQQNTEMEVRIGNKEEITVGAEKRSLYRVEQKLLGLTVTAWIDDNATAWIERSPEGLTAVREDAARAKQGIKGGTLDLASLFAVRVSREIPNPARLSSLRLLIEGIPEDFTDLGDYRQHYKARKFSVEREPVPEHGSYSLPYASKEFEEFLKEEPLLPVRDEKLVTKAREILSGEKDPVEAARKLSAWVHRALEKTPVAGFPNALEAL